MANRIALFVKRIRGKNKGQWVKVSAPQKRAEYLIRKGRGRLAEPSKVGNTFVGGSQAIGRKVTVPGATQSAPKENVASLARESLFKSSFSDVRNTPVGRKAEMRFNNIVDKGMPSWKAEAAMDRRTNATSDPQKLWAWYLKLENENFHDAAIRAKDKFNRMISDKAKRFEKLKEVSRKVSEGQTGNFRLKDLTESRSAVIPLKVQNPKPTGGIVKRRLKI